MSPASPGTSTPRRRRGAWTALSLLVLAVTLRALLSGYGLPHTYHYDEMRTVSAAVRISEEGLRPEDYRYGPLPATVTAGAYGAVFAAGKLLGAWDGAAEFRDLYFRDLSLFLRVARLVSALAGGLACLVLLGAGRAWLRLPDQHARRDALGFVERPDSGARVGPWLAVLALATLPLAVSMGGLALAESLVLLLLAAWLSLAGRYRWNGHGGILLLGGMALGLAGAAKVNALFFIPWHLALPLLNGQGRQGRAWVAAGLGPLLGFLAGAPYALVDLPAVLDALRFNATVSSGSAAFSVAALGAGLREALLGNPAILLGPALGTLAVAGTLIASTRRGWTGAWLASAAWAYLVWNLAATPGSVVPRYLLPALPMLLILAGMALEAFSRTMAGRYGPPPSLLVAGTLLALVLPTTVTTADTLLRQMRPDTREAARAWIETHVPAGSAILLEDSVASPPLAPNPGAVQRDPRGPRRAAALAAEARTAYDLYWLPVPWGMADEREAEALANRGETLPGFSEEERRDLTLERWRDHGVQIVVVSSFVYARHFRDDGDALSAYRAFYQALFEEGELLHRESPGDGDRPGPEIRVILLPPRPAATR